MVKTKGGFDRGMASSHTPSTRRRSTRSSASMQGQGDHVDPDVPLAAEMLNVMVPPELQLSSKDLSSSKKFQILFKTQNRQPLKRLKSKRSPLLQRLLFQNLLFERLILVSLQKSRILLFKRKWLLCLKQFIS